MPTTTKIAHASATPTLDNILAGEQLGEYVIILPARDAREAASGKRRYVAIERNAAGEQIADDFRHAARYDNVTAQTIAAGMRGATVCAVANIPSSERVSTLREVEQPATMVPGETDPTTRTALAELYDGKRDKSLEALAGVLANYGKEAEKRNLTSHHAAPFLAEMRRYLEAAEAAQVRAAAHRSAI